MERFGGDLSVVDADEYCLLRKSQVYSPIWTFKRKDVWNALEAALVRVMWRIQVDAVGFPFQDELIPCLAVLHFPMSEELDIPRQRAFRDIAHET